MTLECGCVRQVLVIDMHPEVGQRQFKLGQWV